MNSTLTAPLRARQADTLPSILDQLVCVADQQVAQRERAWAGLIWLLLVRLERQFRRQLQTDQVVDEDTGGDEVRPTVVRQKELLCERMRNALERTTALKWQAYRYVDVVQQAADPVGWAQVASSPAWLTAAANFARLREAVSELIREVQAIVKEDIALAQDAVLTEIGVGD